MISDTRAEEKLMELVDQFRFYYREKRYREAKICYEDARTIINFLELPEERRIYYFGARYPEVIEGAFPEKKVQKVYEEVCVITKIEHEQEVKRKIQYRDNRKRFRA